MKWQNKRTWIFFEGSWPCEPVPTSWSPPAPCRCDQWRKSSDNDAWGRISHSHCRYWWSVCTAAWVWDDCKFKYVLSYLWNEKMLYEPRHDKTNKVTVRPAKTQISLGVRPVFAVRMKKAWVLSYPISAQRRLWSDWAELPNKRTAKTLIRLGGCPGWSESSLGAQSLCWFCHVAAHIILVIRVFYNRSICIEQENFLWLTVIFDSGVTCRS